MKRRALCFATPSLAVALFGVAHLLGCSTPGDQAATDETLAALTACHMNDGTVEHDALIRACDPGDAKKTTICHVPPGNPANAHTLCIGNAAVPAHLKHHDGDHVGVCKQETECPAPPGPGGAHDGSGTAGNSGAGGQPVTGGVGGNAPEGGIVIVIP